MMYQGIQLAEKYVNIGWGLVALVGKRAYQDNWPNDPITDTNKLNGSNIGLHHRYSNTCALDIDHVAGEYALSLVGIALVDLLTVTPFQIVGNPEKPSKLIFRLPPDVKIKTKKLNWPDPDGQTTPNGQIRKVTIFELRGGHGCQDVLPPSIHPDTNQPYTWVNGPPNSLDDVPFIPTDVLALWQNWEAHNTKFICPWVKLPGPIQQQQSNRKYNGPPDPNFDVAIVQSEFNKQYKPTDILERNGYTRKGKKWLCPSSSTGNPGVIVLKDGLKTISFHGSDDLGDGLPHDAYDCYVILEHGGDKSRAWHTAKKELGLTFASPIISTSDPSKKNSLPAITISNELLIIKAMSHSTCGQRFSSLWKGDFSDYPSRRDAELSLCKILAYWTGRDATRINTLFRRSGLYRPKWNEKNTAGLTYGSRTITLACQSAPKVYVHNRRYRWKAI